MLGRKRRKEPGEVEVIEHAHRERPADGDADQDRVHGGLPGPRALGVEHGEEEVHLGKARRAALSDQKAIKST